MGCLEEIEKENLEETKKCASTEKRNLRPHGHQFLTYEHNSNAPQEGNGFFFFFES